MPTDSPAAALDPRPVPAPATEPSPAERQGVSSRRMRAFTALRRPPSLWQAAFFGALSIAAVFGLWWYATAGETDADRIYPHYVLPSPVETFAKFKPLWFDRALTRNLIITLRRVTSGFGLAVLIGIPLGVLCGCFGWARAFFAPLLLFGRNIPVAALTGLTFFFFGIGELQKVMFIYIACVAFVVSDTAAAVQDVASSYVDTAYTLGANRWQIIMKVLVPLSLPAVFNSLRVLFGLAFGYIMLAEMVKFGSESGGLGDIINTAQRGRGDRAYVYLILMIIPLVAFAIDRLLFWIQRELFPHQYGGAGVLNQLVRATMHAAESVKFLLWRIVGVQPAEAPPLKTVTAHERDDAHSAGQPS
ncbi:MAG: ABC transporter permease [Pirellulales bacterium]